MRFGRGMALRDRRALAIGATVIVPALCFSFVVRPLVRSRIMLREQLQEQRGLLARELGLIAASKRLPVERDAVVAAFTGMQNKLLPGRDALSATATLVTLVGDAARRQGVLLESVESRAPEVAEAGLTAVQVEVRGRGDLEGVLRWLVNLEDSKKLLQVDQLSVEREGGALQRDSSGVEVLALAATVRGYVLTGSEPRGQ